MVIADLVAMALILGVVVIGYKVGVGKVLAVVTGGIVGKIISVLVCYFLYGMILELPFVQNLLKAFVDWISASDSSFVKLLLYIRIDMIVYFVALFIVVQLIRKLVVILIGKALSIIPLVDKTFGILLSLVFFAALVLIAFQITFWITGAEGPLYKLLEGSLLGLDKLYQHNPLNSIIESFDLGMIQYK